MVLSGAGDIQLDVLCAKLKSRFGVESELKPARVPYREKIKAKVEAHGRHKKQTGGSVPKNFFPAVEKGLRDAVQKGVLAGYPLVNLKATLYDGSYHPVDSNEMAFKTAAQLAYKDGIPRAKGVQQRKVLPVIVRRDDEVIPRKGARIAAGRAPQRLHLPFGLHRQLQRQRGQRKDAQIFLAIQRNGGGRALSDALHHRREKLLRGRSRPVLLPQVMPQKQAGRQNAQAAQYHAQRADAPPGHGSLLRRSAPPTASSTSPAAASRAIGHCNRPVCGSLSVGVGAGLSGMMMAGGT